MKDSKTKKISKKLIYEYSFEANNDLEEETTCSLCSKVYAPDSIFLNINCMHTFCLKCVQKNPYFSSDSKHLVIVPCIIDSCKGDINLKEVEEFNNDRQFPKKNFGARKRTPLISSKVDESFIVYTSEEDCLDGNTITHTKLDNNSGLKKIKKKIKDSHKLKCMICSKILEETKAYINKECKHVYCFICFKKNLPKCQGKCIAFGCNESINRTKLYFQISNNIDKIKWEKYKKQCDICKQDRATLMLEDDKRSCEECFYFALKNDLNQYMSVHKEGGDTTLCIMCSSAKREVSFYRCGHVVCCYKCGTSFRNGLCPMCRTRVVDIVRIYMD